MKELLLEECLPYLYDSAQYGCLNGADDMIKQVETELSYSTTEQQKAIEYHNNQLLKIIKGLNPDYPLGAGMIANIKHHREALEKLEK